MNLSASFALFIAMLVLAILPGPGILIVVARTLSQGFRAGIITIIGILSADFIFIFLAILGLSALAQSIGDFFLIVKIFGAIYLVWLGISIIRSSPTKTDAMPHLSQTGNFLAGLITTLSNPKAILFYMSFFPTFLDLTQVNTVDVLIILMIATVAIGGVLLAYATIAFKTGNLVKQSPANKAVKYLSGTMLIGTGVYIASR